MNNLTKTSGSIKKTIFQHVFEPVDKILKLSTSNLFMRLKNIYPLLGKPFKIINNVKNFLKKGYFRKDLNLDIIANIRTEIIQLRFNPIPARKVQYV